MIFDLVGLGVSVMDEADTYRLLEYPASLASGCTAFWASVGSNAVMLVGNVTAVRRHESSVWLWWVCQDSGNHPGRFADPPSACRTEAISSFNFTPTFECLSPLG